MVALDVLIANASFEAAAHYFLRISLLYRSFEHSERTDVSSSASYLPEFIKSRFAFALPASLFKGLKPKQALASLREALQIHITAFAVNKLQDGSASVQEYGSCNLDLDEVLRGDSIAMAPVQVKLFSPSGQYCGTISSEITVFMEQEEEPPTQTHSRASHRAPTNRTERSGHIVQLERENSDGGYGKMMLARSLIDLDHSEQVTSHESLNQDESGQPSLSNLHKIELKEKFLKKESESSTHQSVILFIHDVWDLPLVHNSTTGESSMPSVFVSVKTGAETDENMPAKYCTHVSSPSREAAFGETIIIDLKGPYSLSNVQHLHIGLADKHSKRYLARFHLPISCLYFPTYRQVTLLLRSLSPSVRLPSPKLRISVINVDGSCNSFNALQREYNSKMLFLDFFLKGIESHPLPFAMRTIAVLKLLRNGVEYAAKMKTSQRRFKATQEGMASKRPSLLQNCPILDFDISGRLISDFPLQQRVQFPSLIYSKTKHQPGATDGYFQMTCSSTLESFPTWNQHFIFGIPMDEFTSELSLIIELYKEPTAVDPSPNAPASSTFESFVLGEENQRQIIDMVAYTTVPLGDLTLLPTSKQSKVIPLQNLILHFVDDYSKLAGTDRNEARPMDDRLELEHQPSKISPPGDNTLDLPHVDLDNVLKSIHDDTNNIQTLKNAQKTLQDPTTMVFTFQDIEQRQRLIDRLLKELGERNDAIKKVGEDLYSTRQRNASLEKKIAELERAIQKRETKLAQLMNMIDLEALPIEELKRRYVLLSQKLQQELQVGKEQQVVIDELEQRQLSKSELERKYLELQKAHTSQQLYVQKLQSSLEKIAKYKETIKRQEEIIEKLEGFLKVSLPVSNHEIFGKGLLKSKNDHASLNSDITRLLIEENNRLKTTVGELEKQSQAMQQQKSVETPETPKLQTDPHMSHNKMDEDYAKALLRAEVAEARVSALEAELARRADEFANEITKIRCRVVPLSQ
ncbi:hypothetical protein HDU97_004458, partial [Phlyctochytrium planicorne]